MIQRFNWSVLHIKASVLSHECSTSSFSISSSHAKMKFQLVLTALVGVASAHKAAVTNQLCSTSLGLKSVKNVKTSTKTVNINLTAYKKVCPTLIKTITPKPKTTTRTNTVTSTIISTLPKETDTATVTSTGRFSTLASSL